MGIVAAVFEAVSAEGRAVSRALECEAGIEVEEGLAAAERLDDEPGLVLRRK